MKCDRHTKYAGNKLPTVQCPKCHLLWAEKHRDEYPTCSDVEWVTLRTRPPLKPGVVEALRKTPEDHFAAQFPNIPLKWLRVYKRVDKAAMPPEEQVDIQVKKARETLVVRDLRAENKALYARVQAAELMVANLTALPEARRLPLAVARKVLKSGEVEAEAMPLVFLADWHAGKRIEFKKVLMRNEFNPEVFQARVRRLGDSIVKMVRHYKTMRPIKNVGLISLGDLMENELRTESAATNTLMPFDEQFLVTGALDWLIDYVQVHTDCEIYGHFEYGNHTRNTLKIEWGRIKETSYEYGMALELGRRFESNDKVHIDWAESDQSVLTVLGTRIRVMHGMGINYNKNAGGVSASAYTMIRGWNDGMDNPPRHTYAAHFHHKTDPRGAYFINCLCGYDSYAQGRGFPFSKPSQGMVLYDSKHGRTLDAELFLED